MPDTEMLFKTPVMALLASSTSKNVICWGDKMPEGQCRLHISRQ